MGPRNLTILFISTVAVSLVLLILLFSLVFKNVDLSFDTKMPESAPDLGNFYKDGQPSHTRGDGVGAASVRVPQNPAAVTTPAKPSSGVGDEDLNKLQDEEPISGDTTPEGTDDIPTPPPMSESSSKKDTEKQDAEKPAAKPEPTKPVAPKLLPKPAAPKPAPARIEPEAPSAAPTPAENPAPAGPNG